MTRLLSSQTLTNVVTTLVDDVVTGNYGLLCNLWGLL